MNMFKKLSMEEQIDYIKYMKGQKRLDFEYTITFKGHGMVYDISKEDAEIFYSALSSTDFTNLPKISKV